MRAENACDEMDTYEHPDISYLVERVGMKREGCCGTRESVMVKVGEVWGRLGPYGWTVVMKGEMQH